MARTLPRQSVVLRTKETGKRLLLLPSKILLRQQVHQTSCFSTAVWRSLNWERDIAAAEGPWIRPLSSMRQPFLFNL